MKYNLVFILFLLLSCVEPYERNFNSTNEIIIVEGRVTNASNESFLKLSVSSPRNNAISYIKPIDNAVVSLLEDNSEITLRAASQDGYYNFPANFRGKVGSTYQLKFLLDNGITYLSEIETLNIGEELKKVSHQFEPEGITSLGVTQPALLIFADTQDNASTQDYYYWDWSLYERQYICASCSEGTKYYPDECRTDPSVTKAYDYQCEQECWEIFRNEEVNISNDQLTNGTQINNRLIARLPIYQKDGALIKVKQFNISRNTYDYLKILESQVQNAGSIADSPPATLAGNVYEEGNTNNKIAGYFIIAGVSTFNYWLDKQDIPLDIEPIGILGRKTNLEPGGPDLTRPPLAPCNNSFTRTNRQPAGWRTFEASEK